MRVCVCVEEAACLFKKVLLSKFLRSPVLSRTFHFSAWFYDQRLTSRLPDLCYTPDHHDELLSPAWQTEDYDHFAVNFPMGNHPLYLFDTVALSTGHHSTIKNGLLFLVNDGVTFVDVNDV